MDASPRERTILEAAAAAFYEKGFAGVSVDELGARAGLSGPALYRTFSGKEEILARLLGEAMDELIGATEVVTDDPVADWERALAHHLAYAVSHRHLVSLYQREVRSLGDPWRRPFDRRRRLYGEQWETLFARRFPHVAPADRAPLTQACLGLVFSVAYWPARTVTARTPELLARFVHGALRP